jgi:hypothetical protein
MEAVVKSPGLTVSLRGFEPSALCDIEYELNLFLIEIPYVDPVADSC